MSEIWSCTISRTAVHLPLTRTTFKGLRAKEQSKGYLYLTEPGADYGLPFGRWGDPPLPELDALYPPIAMPIHVAPPRLSSSDLALAATSTLMQHLPSEERVGVGAVIYCHASVNEDLADSVASRLQYELGLRGAFPFSLSQNLCSFLVGAHVASTLLQEENMKGVLIAASEKWIFPFFRSFGSTLVFEDGAAAALVRPPTSSGWRLGALTFHNDPDAPRPFEASPDEVRRRIVQQGTRQIARTLDAARLSPADLAFALHPNLAWSLCEELMSKSGLRHLKGVRDAGRHGHLGAAESIVNLHHAQRSSVADKEQIGLLWAAGLHGEFACCVVSFFNGSVLPADRRAR